MPTISMFYGIIVRMYSEPNGPHHEPHIHVEYAGQNAVVSLNGRWLAGSIPENKLRMVQVWMDIHQEDLQANWNRLYNGEAAFKVDPLK